MEMVYEPEACKAPDSVVSGKVTLKLPTVLQKYDYCDRMGVVLNAQGEVDMSNMNQFKVLKTLVELSESHYTKIDLRKKDGSAVDSWEKMISDPDCEGVITEVATGLLNGFKPSGN